MIRPSVLVATAALSLAAVTFAFAPNPETTIASAETFPPDCLSTQEKNWGVQILYVRLSPDRQSVAVRYRVVDPEKAGRFAAFASKARIKDPRSGIGLNIVDAAPGIPVLGGIHDMVFANPDGALGLRRRVTLQVGPFRLDNLVVRG